MWKKNGSCGGKQGQTPALALSHHFDQHWFLMSPSAVWGNLFGFLPLDIFVGSLPPVPPHGHGTVERLPCHLVPEDPHNRIVQTLLKSSDMGNSLTSARQPSLLPVLNLDSGVYWLTFPGMPVILWPFPCVDNSQGFASGKREQESNYNF